MGDVMALAAFRELSHNARCMWSPMAVLTVGYYLVPFLMAGCAGQGLVPGLAGAKEVHSLLVA